MPANPTSQARCERSRGAACSRQRRVVEASVSAVLVLSRVPQPFSWLLALSLGVAAGCHARGLRSVSLALAAAFALSCVWVRFALPFIYRTHGAARRAPRQPASPPARNAGGCASSAVPASQSPSLAAAQRGPAALPQLPDDLALLILAKLRLADLAAFGRCSRASRALSVAPPLWSRIVVPDQVGSISAAVAAIPRCLPRSVVCTVAVRRGVYVEGQRSRLHRLLGMDCGMRMGVRIARPVVLMPQCEGEEVVVESDAGEALSFLPGAEGSLVAGITVRTLSFASHALAVYATDVRIERCALRASGRNSCGVVVTGSGVRASISRCAISGCGGGGVLLAYGVGPVSISDSAITANGWSGVGAFSGASVVLARCEIKGNAMYALGVARDVSVTLTEQPSGSMDANQLGGLHRYLAPPLHPQISMQSR